MARRSITKTKWKFKDLTDRPDEVEFPVWGLETPETLYSATAVSYAHVAGEGLIHFAQALPSGTARTAVGIAMSRSAIADRFLPSLGDIRKRLEHLRSSGRLAAVKPMLTEDIEGASQYKQMRADHIRASVGDEVAIMDFFRIPGVSRVQAEAFPNTPLEVAGVVRVELPTAVFDTMVREMQDVEEWEPPSERDEGDNDER